MLNSARRHCISPRRGRRVEGSDHRPGIIRLLSVPPELSACASGASEEPVGNTGSIDVTTTDNPLELIPFSDVKVDPGKSKVKKLSGGINKSP